MNMNVLSRGITATIQKRGFQTSAKFGDLSESFSKVVNSASTDYNGILGDQTRSKSEKAPLLAKAQSKARNMLNLKMEGIQTHLNILGNDIESRINTASNYRGNEATQMLMATQLQGSKDIPALVRADPRYFQVLSSLPAGFFGMKSEAMESLKNSGLRTHFPEIQAEIEQYDFDAKHMNSMLDTAKAVDVEFESAISTEAMSTRFSEE
jgi:hypothetical protein